MERLYKSTEFTINQEFPTIILTVTKEKGWYMYHPFYLMFSTLLRLFAILLKEILCLYHAALSFHIILYYLVNAIL
jgi:hypothetical protein